jgi:hypothetical protein
MRGLSGRGWDRPTSTGALCRAMARPASVTSSAISSKQAPPRRNVSASSESAYSRHRAGALRSGASSVSRTIISAICSGAAALSTRGCVAAAASRAVRAEVKNSSRSSPSRSPAADLGRSA